MPLDEFLEYLKRRAGPALRVVMWYAGDDFGELYVRSDLPRDVIATRSRHLAETLTAASDGSAESPLDELGEEAAMVQVRTEVVIIRFPLDGDRGIMASLDASVAKDLHEFVVTCSEKLGDEPVEFRRSAAA
ncbi:MAG: hypothetical protein ABEJ92_01635 [Halobacteriales archaeon]